MYSVRTNKPYLTLVPVLLLLFMTAGIFGIIFNSISLYQNTAKDRLDHVTSNLAPGEFDVAQLYFDHVVNQGAIEIQASVLDVSFTSVDLYLLSSRPSSLSANFSDYYLSLEFNSTYLDHARGVGSEGASLYVEEALTIVYLLIVNPNTESHSWDIKVTYDRNNTDVAGIFAVIGSSIFTVLMILATIGAFIEVFEPASYKPRFLTKELDGKVKNYVDMAESWENVLFGLSLIGLPLGLGSTLSGVESPWFILSIFGIVYFYWAVNSRMRLRSDLITHIVNYKKIELKELAKLVNKKPEQVLKEVFYLISYEAFEAQYNINDKVISYVGESSPRPRVTEPVDTEEFPEIPEEVLKHITCAFCGAEATVDAARFCSECGASMMSTK